MTNITTCQCLDAVLATEVEFDALLGDLQRMSDDHFGVTPDGVTWGNVGTLTG
ncbi:MAG: hypothetical protein AB7O80_09435 [Acetobacteraceae bacterium]